MRYIVLFQGHDWCRRSNHRATQGANWPKPPSQHSRLKASAVLSSSQAKVRERPRMRCRRLPWLRRVKPREARAGRFVCRRQHQIRGTVDSSAPKRPDVTCGQHAHEQLVAGLDPVCAHTCQAQRFSPNKRSHIPRYSSSASYFAEKQSCRPYETCPQSCDPLRVLTLSMCGGLQSR